MNSLDQPETQDPLGLTAAQVAQNRRQAGHHAIAFNTRKSISQTQAGVTYGLDVTAANRLEARAYGGDRQVTQYLAIPLATQAAPTQSGGVVDLDRGYGGGGLRWTHTAELGGAPLTASVGVDYERQKERRTGFINNFGVAGALKRNEDDTVTSTDVYAQLEWQFAPRWNLLAGVRHSRVEFESIDYFIAPGNPNDSGSDQLLAHDAGRGPHIQADPRGESLRQPRAGASRRRPSRSSPTAPTARPASTSPCSPRRASTPRSG